MRIVLVGAGLAAQRCAETLAPTRPRRPDRDVRRRAAAPTTARRCRRRSSPASGRTSELPAGRLVPRPRRRLPPTQRVTSLDDLQFDKALIATGASPVTLAGASPHALTLRTRDDAIALDDALADHEHLAIIGAGLIGQEVASAARRPRHPDHARSTLDRQPVRRPHGPGRRPPPPAALHEANGVELRSRPAADRGRDDDTALDDDHGRRRSVAGRRRRPPGDVPTPRRNVFHAGDVTGSAHWEAAVVGRARTPRARCSACRRSAEQPPLVWSDQYGVRIQRVGEITRRRAERRPDLRTATAASPPSCS